MADSILRLKVESSEYDNKLKRAAEAIRHLADVAHRGGGELTGLEKAELDYIKTLGEMETKSRSAAGQVRELESTYKELKVVYDQLNDVEKADEGGKALAASLETLKQRAQDARASLDNASKSLQLNEEAAKQESSMLDSLAQKFTINIDALKVFNVGLQAAKAALDVAKDAFLSSEANVDEWGRTMAASQSVYQSFLNSLNTGDFSGFLSRIDEIVSAARTAYNELDRLGTMKTIQAPQMSAQQTENERLRMMIQTGRYIAPVDGRKASMADGQQLTKEQIQVLERQLQNGMKAVVTLVGNEVNQTGKAIDALYDRQAKELGLSLAEFRKGTSSMAEFDKRMAGYDQYQKWRSEHTTIDLQSGRETVARGNPYAEYAKWGTFRVDGDRYAQLVQLIQQRNQQSGQAYSMQSQAYRTMNRAEGTTLRQIMGGGGAGGGKTTGATTFAPGSLAEALSEVQKYTKLWQEAGDTVRDSFLPQLVAAEARARQLKEDMEWQKDLAAGKFSGKGDAEFRESMRTATGLSSDKGLKASGNMLMNNNGMDALAKAIEKANKQTKKEDKEETKYLSDGLSQLSGGLGGLQSGFSQLGIDLGDGFGSVVSGLQGITSILMAIQTIIAGIEAISALDAIIPFAHGGIVRAASGTIVGNSYSGDNMRAISAAGQIYGLNAGEVVLNRAQVGNLASQLTGGGLGNLKLETYVDGRALRIVLNNESQGRLRGTYITSRRA